MTLRSIAIPFIDNYFRHITTTAGFKNIDRRKETLALRPLNSFNAKELAEIKKQIEFYFGDSNFPRDKWLRKKAEQDEDRC